VYACGARARVRPPTRVYANARVRARACEFAYPRVRVFTTLYFFLGRKKKKKKKRWKKPSYLTPSIPLSNSLNPYPSTPLPPHPYSLPSFSSSLFFKIPFPVVVSLIVECILVAFPRRSPNGMNRVIAYLYEVKTKV